MSRQRGKRRRFDEDGERQEARDLRSGNGPRRDDRRERFEPRDRPKFRDQVVITAQTPGQKDYIIDVKNHDITFAFGPAGCGKTVIAVGLALQGILAPGSDYDKIIIMRAAKEACGERIGFLPGDMSEKMAPWAAPVVDNMGVFIDQSTIKTLFYQGKVDVIPLAYARGRSLNNAFIIVDEAQNCTIEQMLMILTRIGKDSKMVINGDLSQSDTKGQTKGMLFAAERLEGMDGVAVVELSDRDIVRHPMIGEMIRRLSAPEADTSETESVG